MLQRRKSENSLWRAEVAFSPTETMEMEDLAMLAVWIKCLTSRTMLELIPPQRPLSEEKGTRVVEDSGVRA